MNMIHLIHQTILIRDKWKKEEQVNEKRKE